MRFDEDGNVYIRQSWMDTFSTCPEQARLEIIHPERATESDAANAGTGSHAAVEKFLNGEIGMSEIPDYAYDAALQLCGELDIRFVKFSGVKELCERARAGAGAWARDVAPKVEMGGRAEVKFCVLLYTEPGGRKVFIEGTIDYVADEVYDWKFPGSDWKYKQHLKQSEAVQPTVYCAAAHLLWGWEYPIKFNYGLGIHKRTDRDGVTAEGKFFTTMRFEGHHTFLQRSVQAVLSLVDGVGLDTPWPLIGETSGLCSALWCDHWANCRGQHLSMDQVKWRP